MVIVHTEMNIWFSSWQLVITTHCTDTSYNDCCSGKVRK
jgi:hypothetical protein